MWELVTDLCRAQSGRAAWDHYQYPLAGSLPTVLHTISHFQTCACTCVSQDSTHNRAVWLLYDHRVWLSVSYHLRRLWFSYSSNSTILTILTVTSCWQEWESEGVSEGLCVWVSDGVSEDVWMSDGVSEWGCEWWCEQVRVWASEGVSKWGCEWVMVWASEGVSDGVSKWGCESMLCTASEGVSDGVSIFCFNLRVWVSGLLSSRGQSIQWVLVWEPWARSEDVSVSGLMVLSEWLVWAERVWRSAAMRMWVWAVMVWALRGCEGVQQVRMSPLSVYTINCIVIVRSEIGTQRVLKEWGTSALLLHWWSHIVVLTMYVASQGLLYLRYLLFQDAHLHPEIITFKTHKPYSTSV